MNPLLSPQGIQTPDLTGLSTPTLPPMGSANTGALSSDVSRGQQLLSQLNTRPKTQTQTQSQGPSWAKWLPTAGSLVGSVGGDILGGLLSIPTAGIINPWDTSTVLSGLLGGAGQAGENALQGKNPLQMNDLKQAGIAAGGNLAGFGVGKLLSTGSKVLADIGTQQATEATGQTAAQQTAQDILDKQATNNVNYAGLGYKLQQHLNFGTNQKFFDTLGIDSTNPVELNNATKAGIFANSKYIQALQDSGQTVDTSQFANDAFSAMKNNGVTDLSMSPLGKAISQSGIPVDGLSGLPAESIDAVQARSLAQSINTQMRDLSSKIDSANFNGQTSAAADLENQYNTLKTVQDNLYKQIDTPQVNQAISAIKVTPEERDALVQKYGDKVGNYIADKTDAATTGSELRQIMAPFAQTNEATKIANDFNANVSAGTAANNRAKAEANQVLQQAGVDTTKGKTASTINKVLPAFKIGGAIASVTDPHQNTLLRIAEAAPEAQALLSGGAGASMAGNILSKLGGVTNIPGAVIPTIATAEQGGATPSTAISPIQGGNMQNSILSQILQNDLTASQDVLAHPYMPSSGSGALVGQMNTILPLAQKVAAAEQAVQNLPGYYNAAGGAQGPIGALLSRIQGAITGGPAASYGAQSAAAAQALSNAIGIPSQEAQAAMPQISQNQTAGQLALSNVQKLIQAFAGAGMGQQSNPSILSSL
jgi:hypothetical protein